MADETWHSLVLPLNYAELRTRLALEPWTWVWVTVEYPGANTLVHLALWNGVHFLTANGQVPFNGNVVAYQLIVWPDPFKPAGGDSDSPSRKEGSAD